MLTSRLFEIPSGSKNIDSIKTLGTVHLCQHLIDHSVSDSSAVMASVRSGGVSDPSLHGMCDLNDTHLLGAIESNSSKKSTQGFAALARSNSSLTYRITSVYLHQHLYDD